MSGPDYTVEHVDAIARRPGTRINPEPAQWRIDARGRTLGWVLDTRLDARWAARGATTKHWVPYLGRPYPRGTGLTPCATLNDAIEQLAKAVR